MNKETFFENLGKLYQITPVESVNDCVVAQNKTPSHVFYTAFSVIGGCVVAIPSRDKLYADDLVLLANEVRNQLSRESFHENMLLLVPYDGFGQISAKHYCVAGAAFHDTLSARFPDIQPCSAVAFPVHRCEFSGTESPEIFKLMRKEFVSTLDWNRVPACKAIMAFANNATGVKATNRGLAKVDAVRVQLKSLGCRDKSHIDIENYLGNRIIVTRPEDGLYEFRNQQNFDAVAVVRARDADTEMTKFLRGELVI